MTHAATNMNTGLASAVLLCACASAPSGASPEAADESSRGALAPESGRPEQDAEQFVLIQPDAMVHTHPGDSGQAINKNRSMRVARHVRKLGFFGVYRKVGSRGDRIEVETLGEAAESAHCHGGLSELESFVLRMWVHRNDLVRVTSQPVHQSFGDGTSVHLTPGVGVRPLETGGGGAYAIAVDGLRLSLRIDASKLAYSYRKPRLFEGADSGKMIDNAVFEDRGLELGQGGEVVENGPVVASLTVHDVEPRGDEAIVDIRRDCVALRARVPAGALREVKATLDIAKGQREAKPPYAREGAAVYWPDGTRAGRTVSPAHAGDEVGPVGKRRCFRRALRHIDEAEKSPPARNFLTMCFEPDDIVEEGAARTRRDR